MEIFDLKNKLEYLEEVITLEHDMWAEEPNKNKKTRIENKIKKYFEYINDKNFCKLILVDENTLIGFISIFPHDSREEPLLTPWYATMYVKKEYREKGYSKILNDAILNEAKKRNIKTLYLKTELNNYYEKFGAKFIKYINEKERLLKFDI